jgi:hypothetical protein
MAKTRKADTYSQYFNLTTVIVVIVFVAGFTAGFFVARDRYIKRISEISRMHMEKADVINVLQNELQVLGVQSSPEN